MDPADEGKTTMDPADEGKTTTHPAGEGRTTTDSAGVIANTCSINKTAKLIKKSKKHSEEDCYVIKIGNISYATIKLMSANNGVKVFLSGVVDYNEEENRYYFDDNKNNYAVIKMSSWHRDDPEREARIYQLLHDESPHPLIVQLLGGCSHCPSSGEKCIILECMDMDLLQYAGRRKSWFTTEESQFIFKQIVLGVSHMHRKYIVHHDLGLENICIKKSNSTKYIVKLMDFGHSLFCRDGVDKYVQKQQQIIKIKPCYDAPELGDPNVEFYCPDKSDVWSLGVILVILLVGDYPWRDAPKSQEIIMGLLQRIQENYKVEKDVLDLLQGMLHVDPKQRMNTQRIAEHHWLGS